MPIEFVTSHAIERGFRRIGELAAGDGLLVEVSLHRWKVLTMVHRALEGSAEAKVILPGQDIAEVLSGRVAREQGLPEAWLKEDGRLYLAEKEAKRSLEGDAFGPGLSISVPTAGYLLAMKLRAFPGFPGDEADLRFLLKKMELRSVNEVGEIFGKYFPEIALNPDQLEGVARLLQENGP